MATSRDVCVNEAPGSNEEVVTPTENEQIDLSQVLNTCSPVSVFQGTSNITVDKDVCDYVSTPALEEADEILQNTGWVILCGPPGSGKTTLAYALSRRSREQGFSPYVLGQVQLWRSKIGEKERSIVVLDENFGKVCLDSQQYRDWKKILNTVLEMIKHGWCRLVITVYPHILHELLQLESHWDSPLRDTTATVNLSDTLPTDVRENMLNFHLKKLDLQSDRQCQVVETILQNDESGPVFPWCCAYMVSHWSYSENPTGIFLIPAEAHALLFNEMVLDKIQGPIFVAVLVLTMKVVSHFLHNLSEAASNLQKLGLPNIDDDTLTRYADILQGSILFQGTFSSRGLYEAAGLALGRFFRLPTLLRVCDVPFLVKYVHLTVTGRSVPEGVPFAQCVTTGAVPSCSMDPTCCIVDRRALVERIYTEISVGNLQNIFQHPCLQCPVFLQELEEYCSKDRKRMKQLLNAVDAMHHLPLVYWSAFLPSPNLTHWCLAKVKTVKRLSTVVMMACSLLDQVTQISQCRLPSHLSKTLTVQMFKHRYCVMDVPLPGKCLTKALQEQVELIHGQESLQGRLQYLLDPSLPIPPDLLTVKATTDRLQLQVKDRRLWYLVFRLLTDRVVCETDKDGDSLLHLAVNSGETGVVRLCLKAGALITQKNRKGVTPYLLNQGTRALASKNRKQSDTDQILERIRRADKEEVQFLLLYEVGVNDVSSSGRTGLLLACHEGREDIADLFIELGANVNVEDNMLCTIGRSSLGPVYFACNTALIYACVNGMVCTVKRLIQHEADITTRSEYTALHFAGLCLEHAASADITCHLLQAGADITAQDITGRTPLMFSVGNDQFTITRLLIDHGADVNTQNKEGDTPLLSAAKRGNFNTTKLLICHGANVNAQNRRGDTPLLWVVRSGRFDMVQLLVDHGADVKTCGEQGQTLLLLSVRNEMSDTAELLIDHGADVNACDTDGNTPLLWSVRNGMTETTELLIAHGADVNTVSTEGNTSLLWAARSGHFDIARLLIERGADVNARNIWDDTPLLKATMHSRFGIIILLILHDADVNARDKQGLTPLLWAVARDQSDTVKLLIKHGADVNAHDERGDTPLLWCVRNDLSDTAKLLTDHGADVNAQDADGNTPLMWSVRNGLYDTVKLMIGHGADVNAKNTDGDTPILLSVKNSRSEKNKLRIDQSADVNLHDKQGHSLLLSPALCVWSGMAKLLLDHGANVKANDKQGHTPLRLACMNCRLDIAQLLVDHSGTKRNAGGCAP